MKRVGRYLAAVSGCFAVIAAIFLSRHPIFHSIVPVEALLDETITDYHLAAAVAIIAICVGLAILIGRVLGAETRHEPPLVERRHAHHMGRPFDDAIGSLPLLGVSTDHSTIRSQLRRSAIETLVRRRGMSRNEAELAVRHGHWTENQVVSTFLAAGHEGGVLSGRTITRWRFLRCVQETVDVIESIHTGQPP